MKALYTGGISFDVKWIEMNCVYNLMGKDYN